MKPPRLLFIHSFIQSEAISERGWDPLVELQKSTDLSGWPFTDPVQQPLIWRAAARLLRRFNLPSLISIGVEKHPHKQGASILSIGHPKLLLSPRVGNRSVKWYYGAVMHALSPFRERLLIPVFAVEVSSFESRLANMLRAQPKMAVQKLADHPELTEFLSLALENITHVTKSTEFLVKDVDFLDDLLTAIKQTAPHIVLNYLGFREVVLASPFLPSKLQALSALGRSPSLRKEICLRVVAESLPVMSLYAGFNAFKLGLHNFKAANITAATKDAVSSFVRKINWMDDATKTRVSKKVLTSRVRAFYPDWIIDKFKVFAQYENVPMVTENEGLRSYASIRKALFENTLRTQSANVDDSMVHMPDILPKISRCLVSQVLREGTGDHVSPYSKPAWSDVTKKHFQKTRECFAKQLSETASQNASETEILSVVADSAAISPSFRIYKQFVNQKNIDVKSFVKAFNMDVDQFFFVSYASAALAESNLSFLSAAISGTVVSTAASIAGGVVMPGARPPSAGNGPLSSPVVSSGGLLPAAPQLHGDAAAAEQFVAGMLGQGLAGERLTSNGVHIKQEPVVEEPSSDLEEPMEATPDQLVTGSVLEDDLGSDEVPRPSDGLDTAIGGRNSATEREDNEEAEDLSLSSSTTTSCEMPVLNST
ncbi:hypothetical protein HPB51_004449 [Rhipicephalus microplus]|uniref:Peptidase M13 N-terminal domain-containing protein n=1 Tax=Rhipicephalus microplus TaxID=6941 RepID=A0A9J6EME3_RHIMP|nr:hypothetical protein HPB51_004449 [Rhipicephalus microplus]